MYISTTRLVLPVCKLGTLPVCLSTTRLSANVFICKKAFTSSVFFYNKACTANVLASLTDSVYINNSLVLPVCKLGSLPVCLSTTRLIANVFICKKAFTSSVFFYNNACTASVLTRLTASVFIYKKACTANVFTRLTDSVFIYNKAYCQCVYLQQCLYCQCVNKAYSQCVYLQQGLYCQCVNSAHCQCVYLLQGFLLVCLSTTMLVLPVC